MTVLVCLQNISFKHIITLDDNLECGLWAEASDPWPSLALVLHVRTKTSCPASVLSPRWLLTSSQCLTSVTKTIKVVPFRVVSF